MGPNIVPIGLGRLVPLALALDPSTVQASGMQMTSLLFVPQGNFWGWGDTVTGLSVGSIV